jgi:hypothetical protein
MASADSLKGLMKCLRRAKWQDAFDELLHQHLAPACAKVDVAVEELPELIGDQHFTALWGCVFEDFLARNLDDGRNIVDDYLKRRGWKESASNKAYMTALRSSAMSLYEVSDIVRDASFLARDLVRGGEPVRVIERSGTRSLKPWDRIAARLVQLGTRTEMTGGVLLFDYETSEAVLKALRRAGKKARRDAGELARQLGRDIGDPLIPEALTDTEILRVSAFMFSNIWLGDLLKRTLVPVPPQMFNTDGDELTFTTVSYPLKPEATTDAIGLALAAVPALQRESKTFWSWIGPQPNARKKRRPADGQTFITTLGDGSLVLGTLELKDRMLILEGNSQQRAERGRALIEPVLCQLVGQPSTEARTVAQIMALRPTEKSMASSSGLSADEERAVLHATLDRHYMNLLDEPVAMLGNTSPLAAAKTAKGRERLVAWLKLLENGAARYATGTPMADYDLSWMWDELDITELRR